MKSNCIGNPYYVNQQIAWLGLALPNVLLSKHSGRVTSRVVLDP